jgi:hypothetical protein
MRGRGATRGLHAEHYRRADQPASLFLVAAGARTAEACHDGGEKVLKAFREFRVEGEPALHQRFGWSAAGTFEGEFSNVTRSYAGKGVVRYAW